MRKEKGEALSLQLHGASHVPWAKGSGGGKEEREGAPSVPRSVESFISANNERPSMLDVGSC